jgi:hypothetical protein
VRASPMAMVKMCKKCIEIDLRIAHYEWILSEIRDQPTIDRIKALIAAMVVQKAALHPEKRAS